MDITDFITESMYTDICFLFYCSSGSAPDDFEHDDQTWVKLLMATILQTLSLKPDDEEAKAYAAIIADSMNHLREFPEGQEDELMEAVGVAAREIILAVAKDKIVNPTVADEDQVEQIRPEDIEQIGNREFPNPKEIDT